MLLQVLLEIASDIFPHAAELGTKTLELVVGHLLADIVRGSVERVLPAVNHDLERIAADAFAQATAGEADRATSGDERLIWRQLHETGLRLRSTHAPGDPGAIVHALVVGDTLALQVSVNDFLSSSLRSVEPDIADRCRRRLPVALTQHFAELLKDDRYRGSWQAFIRVLLHDLHRLDTRQSELLEALSEAERAHFRTLLARVEALSDVERTAIASPIPFRFVDDPRMFGAANMAGAFKPARTEYLQQRVHRSTTVDDVTSRLRANGWAIVRGRGASGKTVLAIQLALAAYEPRASYYIDLSEDTHRTGERISAAVKVLAARASAQTLFIVDNVHRDEDGALELYLQWSAAPKGSQLLMLGREVLRGADLRGGQPPLAELEPHRILLTASELDLAGIFYRLARRRVGPTDPVPEPSPHAPGQWRRLFGGDLIAFSAAVERRLPFMLQGDWRLTARDAVDYVRGSYIKPALAELTSLEIIALLAELELVAPDNVLPVEPTAGLSSGFIIESRFGIENWRCYTFVHPGMATLLLEALDIAPDQTDTYQAIARRNSAIGWLIAQRLVSSARAEEAVRVLRASMSTPDRLLAGVVSTSLTYAQPVSEYLVRLGAFSYSEIDEVLAQHPAQIETALVATPPGQLAKLMRFAEGRLPLTRGVVAKALDGAHIAGELAATAIERGVRDVKDLTQLTGKDFSGLRAELRSRLNRADTTTVPANAAMDQGIRDLLWILSASEDDFRAVRAAEWTLDHRSPGRALLQQAIRDGAQSLEDLVNLSRDEFPLLYARMIAYVNIPEVARVLVSRAMETDVRQGGTLAELLALARVGSVQIGALHREVVTRLTDAVHRTDWVLDLLFAPLAMIAKFCEFAVAALPGGVHSVDKALQEPVGQEVIAGRVLRTPISSLPSLLREMRARFPLGYQAVRGGLGRAQRLAESANFVNELFSADLQSAVDALAELKQVSPPFGQMLMRELALPSFRAAIHASLLRTGLDYLAHAFHNPERFGFITTEIWVRLFDEASIESLAHAACRTPLNNVVSFFRSAPMAGKVVASIDRASWDRERTGERGQKPAAVVVLSTVLLRFGRQDLTETPIKMMLVHSTRDEWNADDVDLRHLTNVLRLGQPLGHVMIERFLDRVLDRRWLTREIAKSRTGSLAVALYAVWSYHDNSIVGRFIVPPLRARVEREARAAFWTTETLQLVGVGSLLGILPEKTSIARCEPQQFAELVGAIVPQGFQTTLLVANITAWLGLRAAVSRADSARSIDASLGKRVQAAWQLSVAHTDKQRAVNEWMIEWLAVCERYRWELRRDGGVPPGALR